MKNKRNTRGSIIGCSLLIALISCPVFAGIVTNDVTWNKYYHPATDGLPLDATNVATFTRYPLSGSFGTQTITNGVLKITADATQSMGYFLSGKTNAVNAWNSDSSTLEMTIRGLSTSTNAFGGLTILGTNSYQTLFFHDGKIRFGGTSLYVVTNDLTEWTTLRFVVENLGSVDQNTAKITMYINNDAASAYVYGGASNMWSKATAYDGFRFGNISATSAYTGTMEIESVLWTSGAYHVIPEPATIGMLALGALVTLMFRRQLI